MQKRNDHIAAQFPFCIFDGFGHLQIGKGCISGNILGGGIILGTELVEAQNRNFVALELNHKRSHGLLEIEPTSEIGEFFSIQDGEHLHHPPRAIIHGMVVGQAYRVKVLF